MTELVKITVHFQVDPDDLREAVRRTGLTYARPVCGNSSAFAALIQHCLYDGDDGPLLDGYFHIQPEYVVCDKGEKYRVWHEPSQCYADGEFDDVSNAQLYADTLQRGA